MAVECPYCEKPLPDERAACCGEVGHGVERDTSPSTDRGNTEPLLIHYGPIYDRPQGESMALCSPVGGFATMSNHWPSVNCERCKDKGFYL